MIRIRQVFIEIGNDNEDNIKNKIVGKLKIKREDIISYKINKKSIDARKKNDIHFVYELDVSLKNENNILKKNKSKDIFITPNEEYKFLSTGKAKLNKRPVVVGSGPCGLFIAYMLSEYGYNPIIIERGKSVEERVELVEKFWNEGILDLNTNVQFGEGGAGTFSDGKLNTLVKDKNFRMKKIFEIFVSNGAPEEIMYENNPHIGTNILRKVVKNMREKIISMGGEFRFSSCLTDINIEDNKISSIIINNSEVLKCEVLILAIGHSARDTFKMLYNKGLYMTNKPFAVGLRVEHPQEIISKNQYGEFYAKLKPANYKLTYTTKDKRGVYSFCMCPGGYVVNASSERNKLVVNGMSNYERESKNANSAIVVTVSSSDFGNGVFDGMRYQELLEEKAYRLGKGNIPIQLYEDYLDNRDSVSFKSVLPEIKGKYTFSDLNKLFTENINNSIKEAMNYFDSKIKGFSDGDTLLLGVESRTSSPVRIIRDENLMSNISGIYPAGEGAGYAGGITTSAIDGLKVFEILAKKYSNK